MRVIQPLLVIVIVVAGFSAMTITTQAASSGIVLEDVDVTSEFPEGFRIKVRARSQHEITSIAIRLHIAQQARGGYDYLKFQEGTLVSGELLWRTNTVANYIPPGTAIHYNFEISDSAGNRLETPQEQFVYHDPRFEWDEISDGPVTVFFHGDVDRARITLDTAVKTIASVGPLLGSGTNTPISITLCSTLAEMRRATLSSSRALDQHLITDGQAFTRYGTLLVLGSNNLKATTSHEVIHILVSRAGDGIVRKVPPWLQEGLAEYGSEGHQSSYSSALKAGIRRNDVLPVTHMGSLPGRPNDVLLFYGQAEAIVQMMIEDYGPDTMRQFLALHKGGAKIDDALKQTYGLDRTGIENRWRDSVGVDLYESPYQFANRPTPIPIPTRLPYTLQRHPQGQFVGSIGPNASPDQKSGSNLISDQAQDAITNLDGAPASTNVHGGFSNSEEESSVSGNSCRIVEGSPVDGVLAFGLVGMVTAMAIRERKRRR